MSIDGTKLLFEGFLQKRKDTMKLRWATYWFRLQNTTLFFYTKENCSASHLRGYYYIYTVQSVREVQRTDSNSKRFMFEIIMTNGKRKMLAAETAALRKEWVGHLWQAMNLWTTTISDSTNTHPEAQRERINSTLPITSDSESVLDTLPPRPISAPIDLVHHETRGIASRVGVPEEPDPEEATYQNIVLACSSQSQHDLDGPQSSSVVNGADQKPENDYDVLPIRKNICALSSSAEQEESVYDFPQSYRRTVEQTEQTENIYDVPSSLLRRLSDHSSEENLVDGIYWRI